MFNITSLFGRRTAQGRVNRRFTPDGLAAAALDTRAVPSLSLNVYGYLSSFAHLADPIYYPAPWDPDGNRVLYWYGSAYGETKVVHTFEAPEMIDPNAPLEEQFDLDPDVGQSISIDNMYQLKSNVVIGDNNTLITDIGSINAVQNIDFTVTDVPTSTLYTSPVSVYGGFTVSVGTSQWIQTYNLNLDFSNDFAQVSVSGSQVSASWYNASGFHTYSGSLPFSLSYSGVITDGTFEVRSDVDFSATAIIADYAGDAVAQLDWGFSQSFHA